MVCPKCGYNGGDGLECARCGVIFDKYRRDGGSPGVMPQNIASTAGPMAIPRLPASRSRGLERPRRPLAVTLFRYLAFMALLIGLGAGLDLLRLHLIGNNVFATLRGALDVRRFRGHVVNMDAVLSALRESARKEDYQLPEDRVWLQLKSVSTEVGPLYKITVKVHIPGKFMLVFKHDVYRELSVRLPNRWAKTFTDGVTPPTEAVSKDLEAAGLLREEGKAE